MPQSLKVPLYRWIEHWSQRWPTSEEGRVGWPRCLLIALALVGVALALRLVIAPLNAGLQYVTFFPAVALAALVGGLRAGLLATAMGLSLATVVFTAPYFSMSLDLLLRSAWANLVFLLDGVLVSTVIDALHRHRLRVSRHLQKVQLAEQHTLALNTEMARHIAQRKLVEDQLRVAAMAFETHEAIMITDASANIIRVNQTFERITGYRSAEVIGRNPRLLSSGRHDRQFFSDMWGAILSNGSWSGEIWDRHKSGSLYVKEMTVRAVNNDQGQVTAFVGIFSDISRRKKAEEEIYGLAFLDPLTGLPNRRLLMDRLEQALATSARSAQFGALLFMDMDRFKLLNDTLGHDHGDLLLVEIAKRLKSCVRECDTVARLGGDEFVVVVEDLGDNAETASQVVAQLAETVRAVLAAPYQLRESRHYNSASLGVCLFSGHDESVNELIKRADTAMYQAKESGRNRVRFFDPNLQQLMMARVQLESELRMAVQAQQLRLHYQVQLDQQRQVVGAEALVRWQHPQRGLLNPADFVEVAEASGLIVDVDRWVLNEACRQLARWRELPSLCGLVLAVNVSARQFEQADFVDQVAAAIRLHGVDATSLKLELTESAALGDIRVVVQKMHTLKRELGVWLSLDDFGTGYSSLSYLNRLPIDQIKIDQSFVRDIGSSQRNSVMVKTIIDMARNFDLEVIAEGVESASQLAYLQHNGCSAYQGFLFGRPVPPDEFEALLVQGVPWPGDDAGTHAPGAADGLAHASAL